jgi:hypothetical protein
VTHIQLRASAAHVTGGVAGRGDVAVGAEAWQSCVVRPSLCSSRSCAGPGYCRGSGTRFSIRRSRRSSRAHAPHLRGRDLTSTDRKPEDDERRGRENRLKTTGPSPYHVLKHFFLKLDGLFHRFPFPGPGPSSSALRVLGTINQALCADATHGTSSSVEGLLFAYPYWRERPPVRSLAVLPISRCECEGVPASVPKQMEVCHAFSLGSALSITRHLWGPSPALESVRRTLGSRRM